MAHAQGGTHAVCETPKFLDEHTSRVPLMNGEVTGSSKISKARICNTCICFGRGILLTHTISLDQ
jgi:hypothetical protein